ncbi:hypothetical protein V6N13_041269 [Hibiscus sabdariffa]
MGGKVFLFSFEDDELYIMLEDLNWSYLKEIFCRVEEWSEKSKRPRRATWIEVAGLPLHCWNEVTLRRLAEVWGAVEAFGENVNRVMDCEKVSILISTDIAGRIEESVEIEVGNIVHEVIIFEMGFKDTSVDKVVEDEQSDEVEKAAINDVFFGKEFAVSRGQDLGITERHIGEADLMGDFNSYEALKSGGDFTKGIFPGAKFQETENLREDGDHVEKRDPCVVIKKTQLVDSDSPSFKATEDLLNKGLSQALVDKEFGSKVASEGDSVTKGQAQGALVEVSSNLSAGGGVLIANGGVYRALFSGPIT